MWDFRGLITKYNDASTQLRMYWACTHRTLRETELPVLERAGLRIVPEELNYSVLNYVDSADYLDFRVKRVPGIPREHQRYAARSRLYQRRGLLRDEEKDLFNEHFDVIYCPTSLEIACSIAEWFRGTVVFRHFGSHDNLQSLHAQLKSCDPQLVSRIIYCPIFESLARLSDASRFLSVRTLHGSARFSDINRTWDFNNSEKQISLTINALAASASSREELQPFLESPLSSCIKVFGKNDVASVPDFVKEKLSITGLLPRACYLRHWQRTRLLLYWRPNPFHMHYTPLEAIAAGLPVLFSNDAPLAKENEHQGMSAQQLQELGACKDFRELELRAMELLDDRSSLESLSQRQVELLEPFSDQSLQREARDLISSCERKRSESQVRSSITDGMKIVAKTSARSVIEAYANLKNAKPGSVTVIPLAPFAIATGHDVANHRGQSGICLDSDSPRTNAVVLGRSDEPLNLSGEIHLRIHGGASGEGRIIASYEFWSVEGGFNRKQCVIEQLPGQIVFNECSLASDAPIAVLGVSFAYEGSGRLCIPRLSVRVVQQTGEEGARRAA